MKYLNRIWASLVIVMALAAPLVGPFTAWASDISDAIYIGTVRVHNDNVTATAVSTNMSLSTENLINQGYMDSDALNTALRTHLGVDTPYMPAPGNDTTWALWVPSINGYTQLDYKLYMGGATDMDSALAWFPGSGGMTYTDNASLELGDDFELFYSGWIATGTTDNLTGKTGAIQVSTGSGNVTAAITGGPSLTVELEASEVVLKVWADGVNLYIGVATDEPPGPASYGWLTLGGTELEAGTDNGTIALGGAVTASTPYLVLGQTPLAGGSVPDTADNWTACRAGSIPYVYFYETWVAGTLVQRIEWENDESTFTDLSGTGNDTTPTFLTSSSDADVWAELLDFGPIDVAESGVGGGADPPSIVDTPDEPSGMYTELSVTFPGAVFINSILDGAEIPRALFWFPFFMLLIMLISFAVFWGTKSTVMKAVVLWLCFMMVAAMGGWGWWILIPFAIEEWAAVLAMKKAGW